MDIIKTQESENHFEHHDDIGIVGRGNTIEDCFTNVARVMFSLVVDVEKIHQIQIISFEFNEPDVEAALKTWLMTLLAKGAEHRLVFGDFRLRREGDVWKATVAGEPCRENLEPVIAIKGVTPAMLSVKKIDHTWEACCTIDV